jgi:hypothetical protein
MKKMWSTIQSKYPKSSIALGLILLAGCSPLTVTTAIPVNQTPTSDPAIIDTPAIGDRWEKYEDSKYGFYFLYPALSQTCCVIAGALTGQTQLIITLADESTTTPNTDMPFDGFAIYVVRNRERIALQDYVEQEKAAQIQAGKKIVGESFLPSGSDRIVTIDGQTGTAIQGYSWDRIQRIYVPFPNRDLFLVIAVSEKSEGSFERTISQVLSSFHFADMTANNVPGSVQVLEGPHISYMGILFTLDPAIGSRLHVFDDVTSLNGSIVHHTRFSLTLEEYCQTWCVEVYPIAEFEQAFGFFVFPPAGYRGGAAVIFEAKEIALSFQNGSGNRGLETSGQSHYVVSNESLKYIFRGYSADQQSGIYVQIPIHAANLPDSAPTMTTNVEEILEYNRQVAESMNALTPADFTPNLDLLDALVKSIYVGTQ